MVASGAIVTFAISSVELTNVVLLVFTFDGSATPCSAQVAVAPLAKPVPYTWTLSVWPFSPLFGSVLVTVGPPADGAFPSAGASPGATGSVTESLTQAASSSAT